MNHHYYRKWMVKGLTFLKQALRVPRLYREETPHQWRFPLLLHLLPRLLVVATWA